VLERLAGLRVVADPAALHSAGWQGQDVTVLRFAPDDAFGLGALTVTLDDEHAIVEAEVGYVGVWLPLDQVLPHLEWPLPSARPVLAQGAVAGVPAKVWLPGRDAGRDVRGEGQGAGRGAGDVLLLTAAAYAAELAERLG
jgi:hypothetical protein